MSNLLNEAIDRVKSLSESEQERIAKVIIQEIANTENKDFDEFEAIIEDCKIDTGISDLSYQHDHYLYGKPKQTVE